MATTASRGATGRPSSVGRWRWTRSLSSQHKVHTKHITIQLATVHVIKSILSFLALSKLDPSKALVRLLARILCKLHVDHFAVAAENFA